MLRLALQHSNNKLTNLKSHVRLDIKHPMLWHCRILYFAMRLLVLLTHRCITVKISLTESEGEEGDQQRDHDLKYLISQPLLIYEPVVRAPTANWLHCSITLGFLQLSSSAVPQMEDNIPSQNTTGAVLLNLIYIWQGHRIQKLFDYWQGRSKTKNTSTFRSSEIERMLYVM